MRRYDAVTLLLLLVGGVIVPVAGWVAGAVMLLVSRRWTLRDKLIGLLVWPGGLMTAAALIVFSPTQECVYVDDTGGRRHGGQCTGTTIPGWIGVPLFVLALLGPVVTAVYLGRRARRAARAEAAESSE
ncbi:hypothetical protein [Actinomadura sp. DC4]|uniref:hypothetical protein n=1 Tax=Actinomadura sp. DC4 TaxID=3055069 RepID=UPI0025B178F7|nr:hypothetical protein [Actinomadura sp. DC4]MDN3357118.1 hypothetical protein [Actinomadura sp. DC4]